MTPERKFALDLAIDWLIKSIDPDTGGSRANYSIAFNGPKGWSGPYPETTGYIIPTFLDLALYAEEYNSLEPRAITMGEWLLTVQFDDGAFPGNIYKKGKTNEKSIFNTGQIMLGLTRLYDHTREQKYLDSANRAAKWLVSQQAPSGEWQVYNYVRGFSPSYYSRVSWPILKVFARNGDDTLKNGALSNLKSIQARQLPNGFIEGAGFKPGAPAVLHTLAYTIRGFLESALILNDESLWNTGYLFAEKVFRTFELKKQLYGTWNSDFTGERWYQCLTGNVQMAIIWMKIYQKTGDIRFLNTASKAIDAVVDHQVKRSLDGNAVGGIAGSAPVYGRYMFFRYPNWAAKFFSDAILLESKLLQQLSTRA